MNFEGGHHLKVIRSIGVSLGLWPYRRTILGKMNGALAVTCIFLYIVVQLHNDLSSTVKGVFNNGGYLQLAVIITHEFSVDLFIRCATGIAAPMWCAVKYFYFMWKIDQVKYGFEWIQSDHDSLTNEKELRLLEKSADRGKNICNIILYFTPLLLIFIGFPLLPAFFNIGGSLNQPRSALIPINIEYFVDHDRYFFCIMFHINATIALIISILIATESIIIHFIAHACGLLNLTGERVERVLENSILNVLCGKTSLSIHDQLVATIQLHQRALKFIEYLNTTLLPHYCFLIVIGVISLSMNLYILARGIFLMKVTSEMISAFLLVIVQFIYLSFGNYASQMVLDNGDELFTKTYCTGWHAAPLPVQKILLYIRQRSMQPTGIEFGGLYTGSLEFLFKLLNTSMSYFTVLYATA